MLELLKKTGPLIVTSANRRGEIPALNDEAIEEQLLEVDAVVIGQAGNNPPSTVVDLTTNEPKILRQGRVIL